MHGWRAFVECGPTGRDRRPPVGGAADEVRARTDRPMRPCFSSP
ncbi:hypothetical protein Y09_0984 [Brachybacterium sp. SW0106-09]|nr:hypothetical protein Y09_0984 [Brachybacterium sp. SW0106-09]